MECGTSGIAGSVDEAFRGATTNLVRWLERKYGLNAAEVIRIGNGDGLRHRGSSRSIGSRGGQSPEDCPRGSQAGQLRRRESRDGDPGRRAV
jgi:hypothetical protein